MRRLVLLLACLPAVLLACSDESSSDPIGPVPGADAASDDAKPAEDAAVSDAGKDAPDAAKDGPITGEAGPDAAQPDAPEDSSQPDASQPDAPAEAASPWQEPAGNIIKNGGLEAWTSGAPDFWLGNTSTVDPSLVTSTTDASHGPLALRVANPTVDHVRLSTAPQSVKAGQYDCSYQVKGKGEIRNAHFHGLSGNGYSSYQPSGYLVVNGGWQTVNYSFTLPSDAADVFELIFSVRNTDPELSIDDVACVRKPSPCDTNPCGDWATCDVVTGTCDALPGMCDTAADCWSWETCSASHVCELQPGKCGETFDCSTKPATPVCDTATHTCVAGDPCAAVTCLTWQLCDPAWGKCVAKPGACVTTPDCKQDKPVCDTATHTCQPVDHASNVIRNGGFEQWGDDGFGHQVPLYWMGTDFGTDNTGDNEIPWSKLFKYSTSTHSGALALQVVQAAIAERFTSEGFDLPTGTYSCAYWVRGHGTIRHRVYSKAGWSPYVDFVSIDSDQWIQQTFTLQGNVSQNRLIFYPGYTQADRDHIQIDDVACSKN